MYGLILILFVAYFYLLVSSGIKERTRIKSVSLKGMLQREAILIILPLFVSIGFATENWGSFSNPHNGALVLVFIIIPVALLPVLAEIIIFGLIRNYFTGMKAGILMVCVLVYLWYVTVYGSHYA